MYSLIANYSPVGFITRLVMFACSSRMHYSIMSNTGPLTFTKRSKTTKTTPTSHGDRLPRPHHWHESLNREIADVAWGRECSLLWCRRSRPANVLPTERERRLARLWALYSWILSGRLLLPWPLILTPDLPLAASQAGARYHPTLIGVNYSLVKAKHWFDQTWLLSSFSVQISAY